MLCPLTMSVCIELTTLPTMTPLAHGTYLWTGTFLLEPCAFILKSRTAQSENTMNIFYIIGVIVVVLFVAGFLGLHA